MLKIKYTIRLDSVTIKSLIYKTHSAIDYNNYICITL